MVAMMVQENPQVGTDFLKDRGMLERQAAENDCVSSSWTTAED